MGPRGKGKARQSTSDQQQRSLGKNSPSRPLAPAILMVAEPSTGLAGHELSAGPCPALRGL